MFHPIADSNCRGQYCESGNVNPPFQFWIFPRSVVSPFLILFAIIRRLGFEGESDPFHARYANDAQPEASYAGSRRRQAWSSSWRGRRLAAYDAVELNLSAGEAVTPIRESIAGRVEAEELVRAGRLEEGASNGCFRTLVRIDGLCSSNRRVVGWCGGAAGNKRSP